MVVEALLFFVNTGANGIIQGSIAMGGVGISVGDFAQVKRIFSADEVKEYGKLIGDDNPIHRAQDCYSSNEELSPRAIVHGMFSASLFSSIFGTLIPGSVYRSQSFNFHSPIYTNEYIIGRVDVTKVKDLRKGLLVTCETTVYKKVDIEGETTKEDSDCVLGLEKCVKGTAQVWLPGLRP